jgi:hypothetical protein
VLNSCPAKRGAPLVVSDTVAVDVLVATPRIKIVVREPVTVGPEMTVQLALELEAPVVVEVAQLTSRTMMLPTAWGVREKLAAFPPKEAPTAANVIGHPLR